MNDSDGTSAKSQLSQIFLIVASAGLLPIALSYGLAPQIAMPWLFGLDASDLNLIHILRAIMGLYLALIIFWLSGAFNKALTLPALYCLMVFMLGLAGGRTLSLLVDGVAHWLLTVYLILEVLFGIAALWIIKQQKAHA